MRMPTPLDICFLVISAILFVMYIFFLITLVVYRRSQPFRSVFFSLTLTLGVVDVLQMFHVYLLLKFPSFGWMTNSFYLKLPQPVVKYGIWALAFNQHLAVFIIAVNRFSAIVIPHGHNSRWSPFATRAANFLICSSGVFFVFPKIVYNSTIRYEIVDNITMSATIVWGNQKLLEKYKYVSFFLNLVVNLACFLMYMSILYVALSRHHRTLRAKVSMNTRKNTPAPDAAIIYHRIVRSQSRTGALLILWEKRELKLAMCGFIIFVCMFIYALGVVNMNVYGTAKAQEAKRSIWLYTSDLFSGINPLLIIAVSKSVRNRFFSVLCCSCESTLTPPSSYYMEK
ncbi:hypothetical protein L596_002335 [Steinernema carpocapsae]|uniref:G-protein coupled receptors family 1 profile domain-containing protein n=1 Tax=Steinernema carpocapsae TaxID=34508 RepID=A0A4U8UPF2_STECR|nr:hypothetical protein L596_002335 [Steinernema carpocapsae]